MAIPPIIHQIWIQGRAALPPKYGQACRRWADINASWDYRLWDEESLIALMERRAPKWLPLYTCQQDIWARADVGRYAILEQFGGLYADVDTHCVRPVALFLSKGSAQLRVQVYSPGWKPSAFRQVHFDHVVNSVIACSSGHPIWRPVRAEIVRRNNPVMTVPWRTGPDMFWPIVKNFADEHPGEVDFVDRRHILTSFFLPRFYMHWYGMTRRKVCILDFNDSGRAEGKRIMRNFFGCAFTPRRTSARNRASEGFKD